MQSSKRKIHPPSTATHEGASNSAQVAHQLEGITYEIRGPLTVRAQELKQAGHNIIELNIGNPGAFGFEVPAKLNSAIAKNLDQAGAYCHSQGLVQAREAIVAEATAQGARGLKVENTFIGNGVSELIFQAMFALLSAGDEMLLPSPDYPLWTAMVQMARGVPRYYRCPSSNLWMPDLDHLRSLITPRTRGIVLINPNNPTGALYPKAVLLEILKFAAQNGLTVFSDEIYSKVTYDGSQHTPLATLTDDVPVFTFNGLSKNYFACGLRCGWLYGNPATRSARNSLEGFWQGMTLLSSMRLCANVPAQLAIPTALEGGDQEIFALTQAGGRLANQRDLATSLLNAIPGISCKTPKGALYAFPEFNLPGTEFRNTMDFCLRLLNSAHVLVVPGSGFNYTSKPAFRVTFLPDQKTLRDAMERLDKFIRLQLR